MRSQALRSAVWLMVCVAATGQVIEFESNGLKYQTLTKNGVTVMFARMPSHIREFTTIQVAVANGSHQPYTIRPQDFVWTGGDGTEVRAEAARDVVAMLMEKGSRNDVIKLVSAYESAIYGMPRRSTNGYEARRQAALAEVASTKLKAAAAASAIALVQGKLDPGQSTDGAVFFPREGRDLPPGRLVVNTGTDIFEFNAE